MLSYTQELFLPLVCTTIRHKILIFKKIQGTIQTKNSISTGGKTENYCITGNISICTLLPEAMKYLSWKLRLVAKAASVEEEET
jgi:hypothetical protein